MPPTRCKAHVVTSLLFQAESEDSFNQSCFFPFFFFSFVGEERDQKVPTAVCSKAASKDIFIEGKERVHKLVLLSYLFDSTNQEYGLGVGFVFCSNIPTLGTASITIKTHMQITIS